MPSKKIMLMMEEGPPESFPRGNFLVSPVGDVILAPNDTRSVEKRLNAMWAAVRGAHKIPRKKKQGTKKGTSGQSHRRTYAEVAATPG